MSIGPKGTNLREILIKMSSLLFNKMQRIMPYPKCHIAQASMCQIQHISGSDGDIRVHTRSNGSPTLPRLSPVHGTWLALFGASSTGHHTPGKEKTYAYCLNKTKLYITTPVARASAAMELT